MSGLLRKTLIGVLVSVIVLFILTTLFGVELSDVTAVGLWAFIASSALSMTGLTARSVRFVILVRRYCGEVEIGAFKALLVRLASEFVALLSLSYVGDEAFRLGWLSKKGVNPGRAAWVAYLEIFFDVLVGTLLSIASAVFLLLHGALILGGAVAAIAGTVLLIHIAFLAYSVKSVLKLPDIASKVLTRMLGERGRRAAEAVDSTLREFSEVARRVVKEGAPGLMASNLALTIVGAVLWAASLQVLLNAVGIPIDLASSLLVVYASIALSTLPVTIGGSGLSELGAALSASAVASGNPWGAVVAWRISTYHIPLVICGAAMAWVVADLGRVKAHTSSSLDGRAS